jgi:catechol 2,3-dioxygenase-like lactoylglutathione lyase family enzyme
MPLAYPKLFSSDARRTALKQLHDINIVTHCINDLDTEIAAWTKHLDYRLLQAGALPEALCAAWATPADAGLPYAMLGPASGADVYVRFVQAENRAGYWPPVTWGWNATEILVADPDALAVQLEDSPFNRFGGPGDLYAHPKAPRAIQTTGPSGELLYFTRITAGGSRYGLHGAKSRVDRVFNVVLGGPSLAKLREFYADQLGLRVSAPMPFTMTLAAQATNSSPDALFPICVAPIRARQSILELDEYPATTAARPRSAGQLPGGMSMVTFTTGSLDDFPLPFRAKPQAIAVEPYNGRRVAVIEGPAGEWLELIEAA